VRSTCPSCGSRSIHCKCGHGIPLPGIATTSGRQAPAPRYDPFALSQGLLVDDDLARRLSLGRPVEPAVARAGEAAAPDEPELTVTLSGLLLTDPPVESRERGAKTEERKERAEKREKKEEKETEQPASPAPPRWVPPAWIVPAAALLAFVVAGGGAASVLVPGFATPSPMALAAGLSPLVGGRAEAAPPSAGSRRPDPPLAPPAPLPQATVRTDPAPARTPGSVKAAPQRKRGPERARKAARRAVAGRR
jgi:hypothetical protein